MFLVCPFSEVRLKNHHVISMMAHFNLLGVLVLALVCFLCPVFVLCCVCLSPKLFCMHVYHSICSQR